MDRATRAGSIDGAGSAALLDSLPLPLVFLDAEDLTITEVNQAACAFLGREPAQLHGRVVEQITASTDGVSGAGVGPEASGLVTVRQFARADGSVAAGRVHPIELPLASGMVGMAIIDQTDLHDSLARLDALEASAAGVSSVQSSPDRYVAELQERLRSELGGELSVVWHDVGAQVDAPADPGPSPDGHEPIVVLGREVGVARIRWLQEDSSGHDARVTAAVVGLLGAGFVVSELSNALRTAQLFEAGFDSSQVGLQLVSPEGTYLRVNEAFASMIGRPQSDVVGRNWREVTVEDDLEAAPDVDVPLDLRRRRKLKRYHRPDGSVVWGDITITAVHPDPVQHPEQVVNLAQVIDVTQQVEARLALEDSERRYRTLVEASPDAVIRTCLEGVVTEANRRAMELLGLDRSVSPAGLRLDEVLPESTARTIEQRMRAAVATGEVGEIWRHWFDPEGEKPGWYVIRVVPEIDPTGAPTDTVLLVASDITELVENEQRLASIALVDPLTGLSNRSAIFDRLQHAVDRLERDRAGGVAVALCDLDHFKAINDTFGHRRGDEALCAVAAALRTVVRQQDSVGRLGGDEFVVIFEDVSDQTEADELGRRIQHAVAEAGLDLSDGRRLQLGASVGVARTAGPVSVNDLVARADRAMYQAKRHGRGRTWAEPEPTGSRRRTESNTALRRDLQAALDRDQFVLHYQPIVDAADARPTAVEALLRWDHPSGRRTPSAFLGPLMDSGQIGPVGRWALRSVVHQLAAWRDEGLGHLVVHLNVSPAELSHPGFADELQRLLTDAEVDPARLCVEVTEQALAGTIVSLAALSEVTSAGVRLVLDDFGTGISSLVHLRARPIDGIKIDRSFVSNLETDTTDQCIVEGIISLAHSLQLSVTAEGVESRRQAEWLTEHGCSLHQGWHYGAAVPADEIPALLRPARA
ncbi:MAG: EAL domain-containing protein [Actinomycetota bacterium]